jgi:hypothetical protein
VIVSPLIGRELDLCWSPRYFGSAAIARTDGAIKVTPIRLALNHLVPLREHHTRTDSRSPAA